MSDVALVTGASRGIGRAIAVALGEAGHSVVFCYSSDEAGAAETHAAVEATGAKSLAVKCDISDPASVDAAFREAETAFGPVTILVNNAGITRDGLLMRMSDDQWQAVIDTNLTGAFHTIKRATPAMMKARRGRIVNISSVVAMSGSPGQINYGAAKAGLVGLSRAVARELGTRNITCNVVAPGPIETAMTDSMPDEWKAKTTGSVPLNRFGTPEEVAAVVSFLCSPGAGYITGALVPVDGGLGMGH